MPTQDPGLHPYPRTLGINSEVKCQVPHNVVGKYALMQRKHNGGGNS
jgi:hypothetical protein